MDKIFTNNNIISYNGYLDIFDKINFNSEGSNNKIEISEKSNIADLIVNFYCNNSYVYIGQYGNIKVNLQIGEDCKVIIKDHVYFTNRSFISVAEGTSVEIGNNCMIASKVTFRTNDAHCIFDVESGNRLNKSKNILLEDHCWICENVLISKGTHIRSGSVIGYGSFVSSEIPNNVIAAGIPARIIKKNIAWEAPHLIYTKPFYKNDISCIKKNDKYWKKTKVIYEV